MKKYCYETLYATGFFGAEFTEHRKIIDQYAQNGYRYVGYIPTKMDSQGEIKEMDLIFEIDE